MLNPCNIVIYKSARTILPDVVSPAIVIVKGGKIFKIHRYENETDARNILQDYDPVTIKDFGNAVLMAGIVDTHVHVNEPGRTEWEGFESATRAAAAGGVTTIVDMPLNSIPPTTTVDNLKVKIKMARYKSFVDVGFWGGVVPGNQNDLDGLVKAGVIGFKCFMCPSGVEEFPHIKKEDIVSALKELKRLNSLLAFHAEIEEGQNDSELGDPSAFSSFLKSRPPSMEVKAIKMVIELCKSYNSKCHIVHLSTSDALSMIKEAKEYGAPLTVETCNHYLNIKAEEIPEGATQYKCTPPIRGKENQEELWKALKDGLIDTVISDHSPCLENLKTPGNFMTAWGGIASLQFDLPLFWTGARQRDISLINLSKILSANTARIAGLDGFKGSIKETMDADFVVWNPEGRFILTPYEGKELFGVIVATILRGQLVYSNGIFSDKTKGQLLLNEEFLTNVEFNS